MAYISNFETSATVSERTQEEDHRFLGRVGTGGVANFSFGMSLVWLFYNPAGNVPQQLENESVAGGWG